MGEVFPDGRFFVSAGNPPALSGCIDELLMALGVPASEIPQREADKSALFRTRVSGCRVLVVLDDIDEPGQVHALFDGDPPCAVLVTSRRSPGKSLSAQTLALKSLSEDEVAALAAALLQHLLKPPALDPPAT
jgi:hypothetical protein